MRTAIFLLACFTFTLTAHADTTRPCASSDTLFGAPGYERETCLVVRKSGAQITIYRPVGPRSDGYQPLRVDPETHKIGTHIPHEIEFIVPLGRKAPFVLVHTHENQHHGHIIANR